MAGHQVCQVIKHQGFSRRLHGTNCRDNCRAGASQHVTSWYKHLTSVTSWYKYLTSVTSWYTYLCNFMIWNTVKTLHIYVTFVSSWHTKRTFFVLLILRPLYFAPYPQSWNQWIAKQINDNNINFRSTETGRKTTEWSKVNGPRKVQHPVNIYI